MTKWLGLSICLGFIIICELAIGDETATRPTATLAEAPKKEANAVRIFSKEAAQGIGSEARALAEDTLSMLRDEAAYVRKSVTEAPARIGPAAKSAVPDLVDTLKGDVDYLRKTVSDVLAGPGPWFTEGDEESLPSPHDEVESLADWPMEALEDLGFERLF